MGDSVESRREKRRQKILQNANKRLEKITGVPCTETRNTNGFEMDNEENNLLNYINEPSFSLSENSPFVSLKNLKVENDVNLSSNFLVSHSKFIVVLLALITHSLLIISNLSNYNSCCNYIFVPLLLYKIYQSHIIKKDDNRLYFVNLLLSNYIRQEYSKKFIDCLQTSLDFIQEMFLYFFIFVSWDIILTVLMVSFVP